MSEADDPEVVKVAEEIARYLASHHHAADTLAGIVKWWLVQQRIGEVTDQVKLAVDHLCEKGMLQPTVLSGGETLYKVVNSSQRDEPERN